jgi:hypothetical protein
MVKGVYHSKPFSETPVFTVVDRSLTSLHSRCGSIRNQLDMTCRERSLPFFKLAFESSERILGHDKSKLVDFFVPCVFIGKRIWRGRF